MKIRKELYFGLIFMALVVVGAGAMLLSVEKITNGHLGLLMLSLVVTAIMLGFPTAFTLMGMGMIFTWLAYDKDTTRALDLMVQSAYKTMASDVLIAIPLFVFMGDLVERANLIEKLFKSLHLAMARIPGSLAVATLVTCAIFATATGIVGAVVTLMGLLALPAMLRAGYSVPLAAGAITAGGCLGILIPPSVLLIVYGATAGVSVVQLYAGAFFPGLMLTGLYIAYVILIAKLKPDWAPPLSAANRMVTLPPMTQRLTTGTAAHAFTSLFAALKGKRNADVSMGHILRQLTIVLLPGLLFLLVLVSSYRSVTTVEAEAVYDIQPIGSTSYTARASSSTGGLQEPPISGGLQEPPMAGGLQEPPGSDALQAPPGEPGTVMPSVASAQEPPAPAAATTRDAPTWWWVCFAILGALVSLSAIATPVTFGWFGDANPTGAITAAGHTSVALGGLTAGDLAGIDVLWVLNGNNGGAPGAVTANAAAIDAFVLAGGVLSYHDRYVSGGADSNAALIPGADLITFIRDFSDDQSIDIVTGGTLVTNGPGGVIGNTTLDGGNSSSHGYTLLGTLPAGAVPVFSQTDVTHIVDFYYGYGAGWVYYSTIPLDFYLNGNGNNPPGDAMRDIYAVNEAAQQASLVSRVPEPGSIALLSLGLLLAAQRRKTRA